MGEIACVEIYMQELRMLFLEVGVVYFYFVLLHNSFPGPAFEYFQSDLKPVN
jgi:hypothetical protein